MASDSVPVFEHFQSDELDLKTNFSRKFGSDPHFIVKVPGRVNLIGEHIDYCGFGVLPMAVHFNVTIAVKKNQDESLHVHNCDSKYEDYKCNIKNFCIDLSHGPKWYNYFLCGVKGILETNPAEVAGLTVLVSGNIPPCAGLSSSSALVCAAVLTCAFAFKVKLSKQYLAEISANCERYIGTQGGGMDQAIAFLADSGCAQFIEFDPVRAKSVHLPKSARFVLVHSLTELNKSATDDFNCRVVECKFATFIIAKMILATNKWREFKNLKAVYDVAGLTLDQMSDKVKSVLTAEKYNKDDILNILDINNEEFLGFLTPNTKNLKTFNLRARALHVYEEALRVLTFYQTCESYYNEWCKMNESGDHNGNSDEENILKKLGNLMQESHYSLKEKYECSNLKLDEIVKLGEGITYGSRLTGAGWGGFTVALVHQSKVKTYCDQIRTAFSGGKELKDGKSIFSSEPCRGASVMLC